MSRARTIIPAHVPKIGAPDAREVEDRLAQTPALDELAHGGALAAGQDQPADSIQVGRLAHANALDADGVEGVEMLTEGPLQGQDTDLHGQVNATSCRDGRCDANLARQAVRGSARCRYQPRTARRSCSGISSRAMPRIGAPRPFETSAIFFASSKNVVAWTMALAIRAGSSLLKMPEPTKTPSAPSCMTRAASDGVEMPPATKLTTGSLPLVGDVLHELERRLQLLGGHEQLVLAHPLQTADLAVHVAQLADGLDDVAGPGLALRAHHRGALVDAAERLAEVPTAAHERHLERVLVDVVGLVGRGQDLGLVDVVDAERLEHLRLDEVADACLGHDRDRHGVHDPGDHLGVGHARDAAGLADVGWHALERHHRDGAGVFGDLGLVGRDDVHDDAALEHLGETLLGRPGGGFDGHVGCGFLMVRVARRARRGVSRAFRIMSRAPPEANDGDHPTRPASAGPEWTGRALGARPYASSNV